MVLLLVHGRAIRQQLRATLLPLGVFNLPLAPARAPLLDAAKSKGDHCDKRYAADGGLDGDLRRVGEGVPLLLHTLRGRWVVVAVEGEGFGVTVVGHMLVLNENK